MTECEYAIQLQLNPNNQDDLKVLDARYCDLNEAKEDARIIQRNFLHHKVIIISRPQTLWSVVDEGGAE